MEVIKHIFNFGSVKATIDQNLTLTAINSSSNVISLTAYDAISSATIGYMKDIIYIMDDPYLKVSLFQAKDE